MPLISVVIPVYNGAKTIRDTIESVLHQILSDLELIVINDGSEDSTLDIVASIPDSRLKVFSYSNAGLAASRNRGIFHACGKYISFIDADDLWTPDKLECQFRALQKNPKAAIAYSWTDYIDESGQFLRHGSHLTVNGDVYGHLLLTDFLENGSNALICAYIFKEVGGFDESLTAAEDWDMWLRLAVHYHFVAVPAPQILYRETDKSMSTNVVRQASETQKVIEKAFSQAPDSLKYLKQYSLSNMYKYLLFKALECSTDSHRGLVALKLLWQALLNEPHLPQTRYFWKLLFKSLILTILPPQQAQALLNKVNQRYNLSPLPIFRYEPF